MFPFCWQNLGSEWLLKLFCWKGQFRVPAHSSGGPVKAGQARPLHGSAGVFADLVCSCSVFSSCVRITGLISPHPPTPRIDTQEKPSHTVTTLPRDSFSWMLDSSPTAPVHKHSSARLATLCNQEPSLQFPVPRSSLGLRSHHSGLDGAQLLGFSTETGVRSAIPFSS